MSLNNAYDNTSVWAACPADILLVLLKKLDVKSVINCLYVNTNWRNVVEYYCEHNNLWEAMVQHSIDDEGETITEKSILGWQNQFYTSQQWFNVGNVNVSLQNCIKVDNIRSICVYKDNFIVVTNIAIKFYNIGNFKLTKILEKSNTNIFKYEETSSWIAELLIPCPGATYHGLYITNKLFRHRDTALSTSYQRYLTINSFKLHLNYCYFIDTKNTLWMYTAEETYLKTESLAKYHGNRDTICSIHIYRNNVYILLKRGDVLLLDKECKMFVKIFHFNEPLHCLDSKLCHSLKCLIKAPNSECCEYIEVCSYQRKDYIIRMSRHGVTCVLEHGHTLILGYEDGKIQIYLTRKLIESLEVPELEFNLLTYLDKTIQVDTNLTITSLDIYEDTIGHHLFVSTDSDIYELLLYY